jgi:hypothetical protein
VIRSTIRHRRAWALFIWSLGFAFTSISVQAQIGLSLTLERNEYLLYEALEAKVQVTNQTSEPLDMARMAGDEPWIDFVITTAEGEEITHTDRAWSPPRVGLISGQVRSLTFNLTPYFEIRDPGRYRVTAVVMMAGRRYSSRALNFSLVNGVPIWKQTFIAPPDPADAKRETRPREYSLIIHRDNLRNMLYLRIQNIEAGRVYCTTGLGEVVNYGAPRARIDKRGDCHVFHQSASRTFTYNRFSVMGKRIKARFFTNISSVPSMVVDDDGETEVVGGEELFFDENQKQTTVPTAPFGTPPGQ